MLAQQTVVVAVEYSYCPAPCIVNGDSDVTARPNQSIGSIDVTHSPIQDSVGSKQVSPSSLSLHFFGENDRFDFSLFVFHSAHIVPFGHVFLMCAYFVHTSYS